MIGDQAASVSPSPATAAKWPNGAVASGFGTEAGDMRATIDAARHTWMPRMMFLLVPFVAWLVSRVRRRGRATVPRAPRLRARTFRRRVRDAGPSPPDSGRCRASALGEGLAIVTAIYVVGYTYLALRAPTGSAVGRRPAHTAIVTLGSGYTMMVGSATAVVVAFAMFGRYWLKRSGC